MTPPTVVDLSAASLYRPTFEFSPIDREKLSAFLASPTGLLMLAVLRDRAPNLVETKSLSGDQIIAEAMREKGYFSCITELLELVTAPPEPERKRIDPPLFEEDGRFNEDGTVKHD